MRPSANRVQAQRGPKHLRCRMFGRQPFGFSAHPKPWLAKGMRAVRHGNMQKSYILAALAGLIFDPEHRFFPVRP